MKLNQKYGLVATDLEQRELEMDLVEFDRMKRRVSTGKTRLRRARSVEEIIA